MPTGWERRGADEVRTLLAVFLLLLALAPAGSRNHRRLPVWINPCKASTDGNWRPRGRHADHHHDVELSGRHRPSPKPLRRLRLQAGITKTHILGIYHNLHKQICNKMITFDSQVHPSWLPQNPIKWYKKKIKCLDKKWKVINLLPMFYEGLQRYSATLERLRDPYWVFQPDLECRVQRNMLLDQIAGKLNQLLCELDKCMKDLGIKKGPDLREREGRKLVPVVKDLTSAHFIESSVLFAYRNYIKDWHKIVRQVVGPKGNRICVNKNKRFSIIPN